MVKKLVYISDGSVESEKLKILEENKINISELFRMAIFNYEPNLAENYKLKKELTKKNEERKNLEEDFEIYNTKFKQKIQDIDSKIKIINKKLEIFEQKRDKDLEKLKKEFDEWIEEKYTNEDSEYWFDLFKEEKINNPSLNYRIFLKQNIDVEEDIIEVKEKPKAKIKLLKEWECFADEFIDEGTILEIDEFTANFLIKEGIAEETQEGTPLNMMEVAKKKS